MNAANSPKKCLPTGCPEDILATIVQCYGNHLKKVASLPYLDIRDILFVRFG